MSCYCSCQSQWMSVMGLSAHTPPLIPNDVVAARSPHIMRLNCLQLLFTFLFLFQTPQSGNNTWLFIYMVLIFRVIADVSEVH